MLSKFTMVKAMLNKFEEKALSGNGISYDEGCGLINIPDSDIFEILASTDRIRRFFKGNDVNLCSIINAKSGLCSEDCAFCSQSVHYDTGVKTYPMVEHQKIVEAAKGAMQNGAREFSIVTSGTSVGKDTDVNILARTLKEMKAQVALERCASLGIMNEEALRKLKDAGLQSYHHNLETARSFFPNICTPLENANYLTPIECLKIISLYRFMLPTKDIVVCGGRQVNLRDMQSLIFAAGANGMMIGNYLTTLGRSPEEDLHMIKDLGLKLRK